MITATDQTHIKALFKRFGCNEREVEIYLKLLVLGASSIQEVAKALKCNRVTIHSAVEQLIVKGFCYETRKGKRRLIVAEGPEVLHNLWQKQQNELSLAKQNIAYVSSLISKIQQSTGQPGVKFYEGESGFKKMLEETLEASDEILVFTYVEIFSEILDPQYLEDYFKRRSTQGISTRLIFPPCDFADQVNRKAREYKIEIRFLPPDMKWRSGIFSWGNKVAIKSLTEGKFTCTIIENQDISDFYRRIIFELLWSMARPE